MLTRGSISTAKLAEEKTFIKFLIVIDEMLYEGYAPLISAIASLDPESIIAKASMNQTSGQQETPAASKGSFASILERTRQHVAQRINFN